MTLSDLSRDGKNSRTGRYASANLAASPIPSGWTAARLNFDLLAFAPGPSYDFYLVCDGDFAP